MTGLVTRSIVLAVFLAASEADGETVSADVSVGASATIVVDSEVDDFDLANPHGYFPAEEPVATVLRKITIENVGENEIVNPDVVLNGTPVFPHSISSPLQGTGGQPFLMLAKKWMDRRVHGTTDLDANRDPVAVLTVFGATFCGDDSRALGALAVARGGSMEFARLNGHSVGEFQFPGGRPFLVDGDQRIVYWNWDNRTPCSEEDILADPLLALRTRVFGRQAGWNAASAWQNASRFEFLEPGAARKTFKLKGDRNRWRWIFLPGERITIDFTKSPERVYGATGALQRDSTLRRIAREVTIDFSDVRTGGEIALPWPALRVGGRWVADPGVEPIRIVNLEGGSQEVVCQAAAAEFPFLRTGENEVELKRGNGRIRVTFEIETPNLKAVDAPTVAMTSELLPIMKIGSSSAERIWWQFSNEKEFERILPNLDRVEDFRPQVAPASRIDRTFFSAGEEVWFRAKIRSGGVWSDWSEPVAFTANKPDQPEIRSVEIEEDGQATLSWSGLKGEIMIFGSNRLDFLPDVYVPEEIVRLENGRALAVRENRNLLVAVPASAGSVTVPLRACYRLIARDGELLSVPSRLVRLPRGSNVPPTLVLQNRHVKSDGELTGADIATEVEIP